MTHHTLVNSLVILPKGDSLFSERAIIVGMEDDAGGPYVVVKQERGEIALDPEEWPLVREAIERMLRSCEQCSN